MKMRGLILLTAAMVVTTTSVIMYQPEASIRDAYETARPVEVPYLDLTINQYKEQQNYAKANRAESDVTDGDHQETGEDRREDGQDPDVFDDGTGEESVGEDHVPEDGTGGSVPELVESESTSGVEAGFNNIGDEGFDSEIDAQDSDWTAGLTYLGDWTITAYCPCEICCGQWATGCTASGVLATSNHTVACGILPFGTKVVIDGVIYTVEDTGVEGEWIDIFFDSHEEALNYGMQTKSIYLLEE